MDELFAPPGTQWKPVSPKLVTQRRLFLLLQGLVVTAVALVALWVLEVEILWFGVAGVLLLGLVGWALRLVTRNARSWGYAERDEDLYVRSGVMLRRMVVVPYGRMQYVDVHAGPLDQLFGIANVHLHTASPGTSAVIPGLPADEAARLRDRLTSLGESQAAGL
ncbi:MAG TPA: PH domain-containing protein [Nocardioidaceae bacterium]|nr:PH domain-containing protein [Nocardioidaceae bacterium]